MEFRLLSVLWIIFPTTAEVVTCFPKQHAEGTVTSLRRLSILIGWKDKKDTAALGSAFSIQILPEHSNYSTILTMDQLLEKYCHLWLQILKRLILMLTLQITIWHIVAYLLGYTS